MTLKINCPLCDEVDKYKLKVTGNITELKCECGCTILSFSGVRDRCIEKWDFQRKETPTHKKAKDMMDVE